MNLLPCPLCGGAMQFRKALHVDDGNTDSVIHAAPTDCGLVQFDTNTTDESVIAAWNRRATPPLPAGFVAVPRELGARQLDAAFAALPDLLTSDDQIDKLWCAIRDAEGAILADYDYAGLAAALRDQKQADEYGELCTISRQAADEAAQIIESLAAAPPPEQTAEASAQGGEDECDSCGKPEGCSSEFTGEPWCRDTYHPAVRRLVEAATDADAFIGAMFGTTNGHIPATVKSSIGVPIKLGAIVRDLRAAIAEVTATPAPPPAPERAEPALAAVRSAIRLFADELESKQPVFPAAPNWAEELRVRSECWLARLTDKKPDPAAPQAAAQGEAVPWTKDWASAMALAIDPTLGENEIAIVHGSKRLIYRIDAVAETAALIRRETRTAPPTPADLLARLDELATKWKRSPAWLPRRCADELRAALVGVK